MRMASQLIATRNTERKLLDEYKAKLSINDNILPDPIELKEGWIGKGSWYKALAPIVFNKHNLVLL